MFKLCRLRCLVRLEPREWDRPLPEAVKDSLNRRLANTVLHKVGLVVAVFDLVDLGHSFLFPGDSAHHTRVTFRAVVFRPMAEEVLLGKIKSCTARGVSVSLGFFDDVLIPPVALQHPNRFDDAEQVWVWEYPTDDGAAHDFYMDPGKEIRFRVTADCFVDTSPQGPAAADAKQQGEEEAGTDGAKEDKRIPYLIHGSVNEPGLGLLEWWENT